MSNRHPGRDVLEEVEFFHGIEVTSPREIATRLGMTHAAIAAALRRQDRPDLARPFDRARPRPTHPCTDCAADVASNKATRCRPCGHAQRTRTRYANQETQP